MCAVPGTIMSCEPATPLWIRFATAGGQIGSASPAVAAPDLPPPGEGSAAPLIYRSAERPAALWRLMSDAGPRTVTLRPAMKLSTLLMIREAAIHGAGAALLPRTLVEGDLAAGRLACWGVEAGASTKIWALHASGRLPNAKVASFLRHLERNFG